MNRRANVAREQRRTYAQTASAVCFGLFMGLISPSPVSADTAAVQAVEQFHSELFEVMQDATTLGFEGRRARLEPVIARVFDFTFISAIVLGGDVWKSLDATARTEFVRAFSALTVATYAARFDSHSGEVFETLESKAARANRVLVRTALVRPNDEPVRLDYLLHQRNEIWQIARVVAQSVNEVAIKRAEYRSIIRARGYAELLEMVRAQTRKLGEG